MPCYYAIWRLATSLLPPNLYYAVNLGGILNISCKIHECEKEPVYVSNILRGWGAFLKPSSVQGSSLAATTSQSNQPSLILSPDYYQGPYAPSF